MSVAEPSDVEPHGRGSGRRPRPPVSEAVCAPVSLGSTRRSRRRRCSASPRRTPKRSARRPDERLGFPANTYVLALVGGTGVGKSTHPQRPGRYSRQPGIGPAAHDAVAGRLDPERTHDDLAPLLAWLQIDPGDVREHDERRRCDDVAIVDLPDLDSIEPSHRQRVETLLPRVDAVAWVTDPEKYHDAVLHDDFLRRWVPRLDRQVVVLNKVDRLSPRECQAGSAATSSASWAPRGRSARARRPPVLLVSAAPAGYAYGNTAGPGPRRAAQRGCRRRSRRRPS